MEQNDRERLEANIEEIGQRISAFNNHILNHKHLVSASGVLIMALIFLGMLVPSIEMAAWILCGIFVVALVGTMAYRERQAKMLDAEMAVAQDEMKAYEKGRRKKRK